MQLAFNLCAEDGFWGYINPVLWQTGELYFDVRKYLRENGKLEIAIKLPYNVFEEANVDTGVYIVKKSKMKNFESLVYEFPVKSNCLNDLATGLSFRKLRSDLWQNLDSLKIILNPSFYTIYSKVYNDTVLLKDISNSVRGVLTNKEDVKVTADVGLKPYFVGGLYRYKYSNDFCGLNYGKHLKEKPKNYSFFEGERILIRRLISSEYRLMATLVDKEFVNKKDLYNLKLTNTNYNLKFILAIINSRLISYLKTIGSTNATKEHFRQLTLSDIRQIPIKKADKELQLIFAQKVDTIIACNTKLEELVSSISDFIRSRFSLVKLSTKLKKWYDLEFENFLIELKKVRIRLSLKEETEWLKYFNGEKKKVEVIKMEIDKIDLEIDEMVYQLYELTNEEIEVLGS